MKMARAYDFLRSFFFLIVAISVGQSLHAQSPTYTTLLFQNTGISQNTIHVVGISGSDIVGNYDGSSSVAPGSFLYDGSNYTQLSPPGTVNTYVGGVSANNVVGTYSDGTHSHGFLYNGSGYSTLDFLGSSYTTATGVSGNNIVGNYQVSSELYVYDSTIPYHGFLYNGTTYTTLDPPGSINTLVKGISGNSVFGTYYTSDGGFHGFLYVNGAYTPFGPSGNILTIVRGISGNNIVGTYEDSSGVSHEFFYNGSTYTNLQPIGSTVTNVTAVYGNYVVGRYTDSNGVTHGFLYNGSTYTTLDPSGSTYTTITGISGNEVVGSYNYNNGSYGFLATVMSTITGVTPSPVIGSSAPQSFTINGSGFVAGCNVTLRDLTANQSFPNEVVTSFSSTQIVINASLTTTAHNWSVEVINPDNSTSGQFAFNVTNNYTPPYAFSTLAGTAGQVGSTDGTGSAARFSQPGFMALDGSGNLYVADTNNATVRKIMSGGVVSTIATRAGLNGSPEGLALDGSGNVYVTIVNNNTIRKITPGGSVSVVAGSTGTSGSVDGTGTSALFNQPWGTAVDANGDIFVCDAGNNTIRKITPAGVVTTIAGLAGSQGSTDGIGSAARFFSPYGVALDSSGNIYVGDTGNSTIRKITPAGVVTTLAGSPGQVGSTDGTLSTARFRFPSSLVLDNVGNIYVSDTGNQLIRRITPGGVVSTLGGLADTSGSSDGLGSGARFYNPHGVTVDKNSNIYVADGFNDTIRLGVPSVPVITGVNPAPVPALNSAQTFTVTGLNFTAGCAVTLRNLGSGQSYPNQSIISQTPSGNQIVLDPNFGATESTWSVEVINSLGASSGPYRFQVGTGITPTLGVAAVTSSTFTPVQTGGSSQRTFTLTNNGTTAISGTATVTGPFTITGTATYTLQPGQQQTFTVQFTPSETGAQSGYLSFSGGTGATIPLYGSANTPVTASTFGTITGTVVDTNNYPIPGVAVSTMGSIAYTDFGGSYTILKVPTGSTPVLTFDPGNNTYLGTTQTLGNLLGGATLNAGVTQLQTAPLTTQTSRQSANVPVVVVRGLGAVAATPDPYFFGTDGTSSSGLEGALASAFSNFWDPNANGTVIDGTRSIDYNSRALISYISSKVKAYHVANNFYPPYINFVTHSMGGLIVREALNNQNHITCLVDGSNVIIPVKYIVMLAPPNSGSPIADVFKISPELAVFGLWQPFWDSTSCLTTYNVGLFNIQYNQISPDITCFLLAGTGGQASANQELVWGSGIITGASGGIPDETTNDGAVARASVSGTYYNTPQIDSTDILNPFTDILSPFGISDSIPDSTVDLGFNNVTDLQAVGYSMDHLSILKDNNSSGINAWVIKILQTGNLPLAQPQAVKALSIASRTGASNALATSTIALPVEQFDNETGSLAQGASTNMSVACDAATTFKLNLSTSGVGINFTLQSPSGKIISPATSQTDSTVTYIQTSDPSTGLTSITYAITSPEQGNWTVMLDGTELTSSSVIYQLSATGDSSVVMQPATGSYAHSGHEAVIGCWLLNTGMTPPVPVVSSSITAQIVYPDGTTNTQTLLDDGFHGDGAANDGAYATILPNLTEPGQYYVTYRVSGDYSANQPFTRYATSVFTVSTEDASIAGNLSSQPANVNSSGAAQSICVTCLVNAAVPGTYLLSGILTDSTGTLQIPASVRMENVTVGISSATLYFDLSTFRQAGYTGTATLTDIQLSEQTASSIQWLDAYPDTFPIQIGPQISSQPQTSSVTIGGATQLSVGASGDGNLSYQWFYNGTPITGQTGAALSLTNVTPDQEGNYNVMVTGSTGSVTTPSVGLSVHGNFSQWVAAYGVSSDPSATPQHDGVPNLLKYLYNINPMRPMNGADRIETGGTRVTEILYEESDLDED